MLSRLVIEYDGVEINLISEPLYGQDYWAHVLALLKHATAAAQINQAKHETRALLRRVRDRHG